MEADTSLICLTWNAQQEVSKGIDYRSKIQPCAAMHVFTFLCGGVYKLFQQYKQLSKASSASAAAADNAADKLRCITHS